MYNNKKFVTYAVILAAFFSPFALSHTVTDKVPVPVPDVTINQSGQHIVINIPQTRLFLFNNGILVNSYPVAVGKAKTQTPIGEYTARGAIYNPTWTVPRSIQKEMQLNGKEVIASVPPGPKNPLGPVFIRVGDQKLGLGIHGTNAPYSVPGIRSHGCIRMKSYNALTMAKTIKIGTPISVIYQPIILNKDEAGQLWISVFRDAYHKGNINHEMLTNAFLDWQNSSEQLIDNKLINQAIKLHSGKPLCLTCQEKKAEITGNLTPIKWLSSQTPAPMAQINSAIKKQNASAAIEENLAPSK